MCEAVIPGCKPAYFYRHEREADASTLLGLSGRLDQYRGLVPLIRALQTRCLGIRVANANEWRTTPNCGDCVLRKRMLPHIRTKRTLRPV
jgi:hypothetical protein